MRFKLRSGLNVGYLTRGSGPVVALLHPVGLDTRFWRPLVQHLSPFCRSIAIDARGHGESDVPGQAFSLDEVAADCVELLSALAPEPVLVVGCSMGGAVAQRIAYRFPKLVRGLVLANCSGPRPDGSNAYLLKRAEEAIRGMPTILEETIDRWFSPDFALCRPDVVTEVRNWLLEADPMVHSWTWRAMADRISLDQLKEIATSTLVVTGALDKSATPESVRPLAACLKNSTYEELAETGHLSPLERPRELARLIRSHLESLVDARLAQA